MPPIITFTIPIKARVFLLEDSDHRILWFQERIHDLTVANTSAEGIAILESNPPFDVIFLDHDLQLIHYEEFDETGKGTGREVAAWLAKKGFSGKNVCIH